MKIKIDWLFSQALLLVLEVTIKSACILLDRAEKIGMQAEHELLEIKKEMEGIE